MGTEETLQISWVFYAGNWYEDKKIQAAATNHLLKNGTRTKNAFEINEHFEYYGAYMNRSCYTETSDITLHCLNKHIDQLLPVVAELITEASFPEDELKLFQQNSEQRLKVNLQKGDFVANRLIDALVFGEQHPYGTYTNLEDYSNLNREDLLTFYENYYVKGHCVLFVAGKLPEGLMEKLDHHFGSLQLSSHRLHNKNREHLVVPSVEMKKQVSVDPKGVQASIRLARPFPNRHHPDFQKASLLNTIYGGYFGSRLMENIREDKGYTYGIYSYIQNHLGPTSMIVSTEAGRDVSAATIEEVYKEMKVLREELIDEDELLTTRNFMLGSLLGDLDGAFSVMSRWRSLILNGLDADYFYRGIEVIRSTSPEELKELAERYFQPEAFYELVVI
jgi:predicted Zn-dependent peptidase